MNHKTETIRVVGLLSIFLVVLSSVSCRSGRQETSDRNVSGNNTQEASTASVEVVEKPGENWGRFSGRVVLDGEKPEPEKFRVPDQLQDACDLPEVVMRKWVHIDDETRGVRDVFVVVEGLQTALAPEMPPKKVVLEMKNCRLNPNIFLVRAGGMVLVKHTEGPGHNFRYHEAGSSRGGGSVNLQNESHELEFRNNHFVMFESHPWMKGMFRSQNHHAIALTKKKGRFSFTLPPGSYTLILRHFRMKEPKRVKIDIEKEKSTEREFSVSIS